MSEPNQNRKDAPILEYVILGIVIALFFLFIFRMTRGDIDLAHSVFNGLASGRYGVQKYIGWEELQGLTIDVGATYSKFNTAEEKAGYKKAFIQSFSHGFSQVKGDTRSFVNWRIYSKDNDRVIIAADYLGHNKTLLMTFSGAKNKLTSLQWEEPDAKK